MNIVIDSFAKEVDQVIHFGFNEPSLTFLTSHKALQRDISNYDQNKKILYLVEQNFEDSILNNKELSNFRLVDEIKGFNYSQGKTKL